MTAQEKHSANLELYLQNGGSKRIYNLYFLPTLENRAKMISFLLSMKIEPAKEKLSAEPKNLSTEPIIKPQEKEPESIVEFTPHHKLLGYISQYPEELHSAYTKAFNSWLKACSLKVKLNAIPAQEEREAFMVQWEIWECMQEFDRCKNALDYFKREKVTLPTELKEDLTKKGDLELDKRMRNLRSLIIKRNDTVKKMYDHLPEADSPKFNQKNAVLRKKIEELEQYKLELAEIQKEIAKRFGT